MAMDSVISDPPTSYLTDSYMFCEWAERVLTEVEGNKANHVAMTLYSVTSLIERLRTYVADHASKPSAALVISIDAMELAVSNADTYESTIVIPSAPFINLAHRVMEYAYH